MKKVKEFVLKGIDLSAPLHAGDHSFWAALRQAGTEVWLDTGDLDEAASLWCNSMTALTTNNTLLNKEIQKGIYDDLIPEANKLLAGLDLHERIVEIAFILNARHGLKLAEKFGGKISVELHTDMAHDIDRSVWYAERFFDICPEHFIIKIPLTPSGYIATRRIREKQIPVNFTLNFSVRQNLIAAYFSKPSYVNIFLGRLNAFVEDNKLGDGRMVGEKVTLASQRVVAACSRQNPEPTRQIAASLRDASQLASLAGVDVYTVPVAVARAGVTELRPLFRNNTDQDYAVQMADEADLGLLQIEKLWNYTEVEHAFARGLDKNPPATAEEFMARAHAAGLQDLFPQFDGGQHARIATDGKIPVYAHWQEELKAGKASVDALLNAAGLASFTADQKALDDRIRSLIA
ncbi:MAG: transaldolase family protein [Bacteroidales bacterium]|nr:transaldolase family protein [Bacteroidales bacterium]